MRLFLNALLATLAFGVLAAGPAAAARWTCIGPEFVCADSGSSGKSGSKWSSSSQWDSPAPKAKSKKSSKSAESWGSSDEYLPKKAPKSAAKTASISKESGWTWSDDSKPQAPKAAPKWDGGSTSYESGVASYYWQPQKVASGGWFDPNAMTAAHKSLPFGTKVRVTHVGNGKSVDVVINDRGPYVGGRVIDLSSAAAGQLGMKSQGIANVKIAILK